MAAGKWLNSVTDAERWEPAVLRSWDPSTGETIGILLVVASVRKSSKTPRNSREREIYVHERKQGHFRKSNNKLFEQTPHLNQVIENDTLIKTCDQCAILADEIVAKYSSALKPRRSF